MRYWTEDEARAALPRVALLVEVVRAASEQQRGARSNGHGVAPRVEPGTDLPTAEAALEELGSLDVVVRDAGTGLVDFPARSRSGRVYLLCWRSGEDDLRWWHFAEEGFAGRKPLPFTEDA